MRLHMIRTAAASLPLCALVATSFACSGADPMPSGTQRLEERGPRGQTKVSVSGPEGITGGVTRSEPAYFSIELAVEGPSAAMSVIRVPNPSPRGCNVTGGLPAYAELDGSGSARVEAFVTFWDEERCEFEVVAETGTEYEGYRPDPNTGKFVDYELSGARDAARVSVSFANLDRT